MHCLTVWNKCFTSVTGQGWAWLGLEMIPIQDSLRNCHGSEGHWSCTAFLDKRSPVMSDMHIMWSGMFCISWSELSGFWMMWLKWLKYLQGRCHNLVVNSVSKGLNIFLLNCMPYTRSIYIPNFIQISWVLQIVRAFTNQQAIQCNLN